MQQKKQRIRIHWSNAMNDVKSTENTSSEETSGASADVESTDATSLKETSGALPQSEEKANEDTSQYTTDIIFSAPFRTDIVLDSKKLLKGYNEYRNKVEQELNSSSQFAGWKFDPHIDISKTSSYGLISPDKPGLTTIAPYFIGYVIRADDKCNNDTLEHLQTKINDELNSKINKIISNSREKENQYNFGDNFILTKVKLKFYEFGFGSITVHVECKKAEILKTSDLKYAIESDTIKSFFEDFISGYINEYEKSVQSVLDKLLQKPQFEPHNNLVEAKKVYWTHRLISFILTPEFINSGEKVNMDANDAENNSLKKDKVSEFYYEKKTLLTQTIAVDNEDQIIISELRMKKQIFIPGVGNSILISESDKNLVSYAPEKKKEAELENYLEQKIDNISNIISTVGTHFAFVHHFYENLLYFVNKIIKESEKKKAKKINFVTGEIDKLINGIVEKLDIFFHINFLLQEYKLSYLSSIGKGAYHKLVEVWEFDKQWAGVKEQIGTLEKIYDRNYDIISKRQKTALNSVAITFSVAVGLPSLGNVDLFNIKLDFLTIDSIAFDTIFTLLCIAVLAYFVYKIAAFFFRKCISKLCNCMISFCQKISAKGNH